MMPSAVLSHYVYNPNPQITNLFNPNPQITNLFNPNPQITIPRPNRSKICEICVIILPYLFFFFFKKENPIISWQFQ